MTKIDESTTLAMVVDAFPHLTRELQRRDLDFCCGGQRTLADACAEAGLDPATTVAELAELSEVDGTPEIAEWTTMSAVELVDHIESTHHKFLWEDLPRVTALAEKIVMVHGERHPELAEIARCFAEVRADLEPHLTKEERVLFPAIRELADSSEMPTFNFGSLQNPISVMMSEHDTVGDLLTELRRLTNDYTTPADGCATYAACFAGMEEIEADTHLHVHKENNVLFPMVVQMESEFAASVG